MTFCTHDNLYSCKKQKFLIEAPLNSFPACWSIPALCIHFHVSTKGIRGQQLVERNFQGIIYLANSCPCLLLESPPADCNYFFNAAYFFNLPWAMLFTKHTQFASSTWHLEQGCIGGIQQCNRPRHTTDVQRCFCLLTGLMLNPWALKPCTQACA